jgi:hypothetical protein
MKEREEQKKYHCKHKEIGYGSQQNEKLSAMENGDQQ